MASVVQEAQCDRWPLNGVSAVPSWSVGWGEFCVSTCCLLTSCHVLVSMAACAQSLGRHQDDCE